MRVADSSARPKYGELLSPLRPHLPFLMLLGFLIVVGVWLANDYGNSWDEPANAQVGEAALRAYSGSLDYFSKPAILDHGPVYFMIFSSIGQLVHRLAPEWTVPDGRHLTNYFAFLISVILLYSLCLRSLAPRFALITTMLFVSQPVIFGYAFINQKDIPFMAFFLAALVLGMKMVDSMSAKAGPAEALARTASQASAPGLKVALNSEWHDLTLARRFGLVAVSGLAIAVSVDLVKTGVILRLTEAVISAAYRGHAFFPLQLIFQTLFSHAEQMPLTFYLQKLDKGFLYFSENAVPFLVLAPVILSSWALPSLGRIWGFEWKIIRNPLMIATGASIGLAIGIRQVGVFAIGLIGLYMALRWRGKAIFPVLVMSFFAGVVTVATWPYLWRNPLRHFLDSLALAANFPTHHTLFLGHRFVASRLPWTFFPTMLGIELTAPAVALIILGFAAAAWHTVKRRSRPSDFSILLIVWLAIPLLMLFFSKMTIYGNIRHLLFLLPPLFVLIGIALEAISSRIRWDWFRTLLASAIILPGLVAIVGLHPYEYIYYNTFVGGVEGARDRFELDRWCISLREGIEIVNAIAGQGAIVAVPPNPEIVVPFARQDLHLRNSLVEVPKADYVVSCNFKATGVWDTDGHTEIYVVARGNEALTSIWKRDVTP